MKRIAILLLPIFLLYGCTSRITSNKNVPKSENIVINSQNDEEYELTIIDSGFQTWFASYAKPINFYSKSYYESQNRRYVSSWNELYQRTGGAGPFGNYVDYRFTEDYGLELNYELFWYFKYIETMYGSRYNFPS